MLPQFLIYHFRAFPGFKLFWFSHHDYYSLAIRCQTQHLRLKHLFIMTTSLARQLQGIQQTAANVNFQKRKKVASLLFDASEAADQDYDQVFALAINGFEELLSHDSSISRFAQTIFSDEARQIDRYVQTQEQNDSLDKTIRSFISTTASHFLLRPLLKCLEWLVRRFDIHIHLADFLLLSYMPFHSSTNYKSLLAIIQLPSSWEFLGAVRRSGEQPSTHLYVKAFVSEVSLLKTYLAHVHQVVTSKKGFHALYTKYADLAVRTIALMRDNKQDEEIIITAFLPTAGEGVQITSSTEYQIANYMVLTVLAASRSLSENATNAVMQALATGLTNSSQRSGLICLAQLCQAQESVTALPKSVSQAIKQLDDGVDNVLALAEKYRADKLLTSLALAALAELNADSVTIVTRIAESGRVPLQPVLTAMVQHVLASSEHQKFRVACASCFETLQQNATCGKQLNDFYTSLGPKLADLELALQITLGIPSAVLLSPKKRRQSSSRVVATDENITSLEYPTGSFLAVNDVRRTLNILQSAVSSGKFQTFLNDARLDNFDTKATFLVRVAISSHDSDTQVAASQALLEICEAREDTDFQALLPMLIILLSTKSQKVRKTGSSLLNLLIKQAKSSSKQSVWAIDALYGPESSKDLKWLSPDESLSLLKHIETRAPECQLSHKTIYSVIGGYLSNSGLKSKETSARTAGLQFLASHITCSPIMKIVLRILLCFDRSENPVYSRAKATMPLLQAWVQSSASYDTQCSLELIDPDVLKRLLMRQILAKDGKSVEFMITLLRKKDESLGPKIIQRLAELYSSLKSEYQCDFVRAAIDARLDASSKILRQATESIEGLSIPTDLLIQLFSEVNLTSVSSTPAKRQKRTTTDQTMDIAINRLTHLLEILEHDDRTHAELLPTLFGKLGDLVAAEADNKVSVSYAEQILLSCMSKLVEHGQVDSSACRIDILINCIRTSTSSQVHNRALLLVASLAEIVPEQVLHGVMPIFTFMGANVLQQDDGFSAHVIDSTVRRIVPPLLKSLGEKTEDRISGSAGIMRSFVDAFPQVPKHRRVKLFETLVKTLGETTFLAPLLALLIQRGCQANHDEQYSDFSLTLLSQFSMEIQLDAVLGLLVLTNQMQEESGETETLLDIHESKEDSLADVTNSIIEVIKRHFASKKVRSDLDHTVLEGPQWSHKRVFADILTTLLSTCEKLETRPQALDTALETLDSVTLLLPMTLFKEIITSLLHKTTDDLYRHKALEIIANRAMTVTSEQEDSRQSFLELISEIAAATQSEQSSVVLCAAFQCISTLGRRFGKSSPGTFVSVAELVIGDNGLKSEDLLVRVSATDCLTTMALVLGPRILPYLQRFMSTVLDGLDNKIDLDQQDADLVPLSSLALLEALVRTIPSFMTPHTQLMIERCAVSADTTEDLLAEKKSLLTTIAKHMPTRNILESLGSAWERSITIGKSALLSLVSVIEETIESSDRKVVTGSAYEIITLFLQALDIRQRCKSLDNRTLERIEKRIISVFLKVVLKLNDSTFRPLFVRLRDWALSETTNADTLLGRRLVFFNFFSQFIGTFKTIVLNYFNYVLEDMLELLQLCPDLVLVPRKLWQSITSALESGFKADNEDFWRSPEKFGRLAPVLISHLQYADTYAVQSSLIPAIVELTSAASSEENFKVVNTQVLQLFRAERASVRLAAVTTENKLSSKLGEEWLSMLPQTIPFIAEAMEDDDERVEKQTHSLALTIESFFGESIEKFLR